MLTTGHPRLDAVHEFAEHVARVPWARILITGESGTGKSLLARCIHGMSGLPGRFVDVNCAALPANLLESELFGHEKGAFTDARETRVGLIEAAHRGTLLLDEIGALPLELQAKLLLFLENQEVRRVGGRFPVPVQTRVIAATNEDLQARVRNRSFRADLFYRLDVASIEMPPLRSMPEMIPTIAEHFLRRAAAEFGRPVPRVDQRTFQALTAHSWPGNMRELRNVVERAVIFMPPGPLRIQPPPERGAATPAGPGVTVELGLELAEVEHRYIQATLGARRGRDLTAIARSLGISRKTLWERRRRLDPGR
jgi:DNA-binding NtrC family response regulator